MLQMPLSRTATAGIAAALASAFAWAAEPAAPQPAATVATYCSTCHNAKLKTADFVLEPGSLKNVPAEAERLEKAVRKLRSGSMPPPGAPRPDAAAYAALRGFLETELDRAAAAHPNAGRLPLLRRLTRTEYRNAVRDLLALEWLPEEMSYSMLLPADNSASGFDNIADLLFVPPAAMESYLNAAEKISRLAVGNASAPVMVNIHRLPDEQPQTSHVDGLPLGTRGGLLIRSHFPLDGDYIVKAAFVGESREPQQLELTVDGERAGIAPVAASPGGRFARLNGLPVLTRPVEFRVPMKAGPRRVGVAFLERNELRDEDVLRPRTRGAGPELGLEVVTISGPYDVRGPGETPSRERVFLCRPAAASEEDPCAERILAALARRAYRRPATAADVQLLMPFYRAGKAEGGFERGVERALERLLVSPQFLFRIEREPESAPGVSRPASDLELASRLSFFLWSSIPDEELLTAAGEGNLSRPGMLERQAARMLADPRSSSLVTNFAEQWLYLRDLEQKKPNEILFPDFDEGLRESFRRETSLFLDSVLRGNRGVLDLLSADYTFVNERLAKHYGIPHVVGSEFRRVTFPPGSPRGGLLGQGSILTITAYANRTSPVTRGKWVLENLLLSAPPPPPADVPAFKAEKEGTNKVLSMREAMLQHRANPACFGCHARMDPIGFAMENFDAIGRWRETDAGSPIDASGVFPGGVKFDGMPGLKKTLLEQPEEFVSTVAEKLLMYAIGRNVQYFDQSAVRAIVRASASEGHTFSSLVMGVVQSVPFRMRQARAAAPQAAEGVRKQP
jgi:mono/diheme cytochrome c family protein